MTDKIEYYRDKVEQYFLSLNNEILDYEMYSRFLKETELDKILASKEDEDSFWEYCCCKSELITNNLETSNNNLINKEMILKVISEILSEISSTKIKPIQENVNFEDENFISTLNFDYQLVKILKSFYINDFIQLRKVFNELEVKNKLIVEFEELENLLNTNLVTIPLEILYKIFFLISTSHNSFYLSKDSNGSTNNKEYSNFDWKEILELRKKLILIDGLVLKLIKFIEQRILSDENFLDEEKYKNIVIDIPNNPDNLLTDIENLEIENRGNAFLISKKISRIYEEIVLFKIDVIKYWGKDNDRLTTSISNKLNNLLRYTEGEKNTNKLMNNFEKNVIEIQNEIKEVHSNKNCLNMSKK